MKKVSSLLIIVLLTFHTVNAFLSICSSSAGQFATGLSMSTSDESSSLSEAAGKFKVLACSSTSCAAKRKALNLDQFSTFSAFYSKIQENAPTMTIEESPCLGSCKFAPCVGVEHEEFEGPVSLDGMTPSEFSQRVFHGVLFDDDVDRVWSSIQNAIQVMAEEEEVAETNEAI